MQMFGDDDWKKIDSKIQSFGNDYYRTELFADKPTMAQAESDYQSFRTGTPAMDKVAADMRRFYELNAPVPVAAPVAPVAAPVAVKVTPEVQAQTLKDEVVKEVIKNNPEAVQKIKEDIIIEKDLSTSNPYIEHPIVIDTSWQEKMDEESKNNLTMLAIAGGGLLAGNSVSSPPAEPKLTEEQLIILREAGLI